VEIKLIKEEKSFDAVLSVNLSIQDFEEEANTKLKAEKQKLNLPGFRKGMVPNSVAKKYLWEHVVKDALEAKLEDTINSYFDDNKIEIIKPALPIAPDNPIDLKNDTEFEFKYDIGLVDEIIIEEEKLFKKLNSLDIKIEDKDLDKEIDKIQFTYGENKQPEQIDDVNDYRVFLEITELGEDNEALEDGISQKVAKNIEELNPKLKEAVLGKKKDDLVKVNLHEIFTDKDEMATFLNIEKLTAEDANPDFNVKIMSISHHIKAEINEDLFDKATAGKAKTLEEFRAHVEEMLMANYVKSSENMLFDDITQVMIDKVKLDMPVKFLDRLFDEEFKDKKKDLSAEDLQKERAEFGKKIKWSLITKNISEKNKIEINEQEIVQEAYLFINSYFMQYGMTGITDDQMQNYLTDYLKNQNNVMYMKERVMVNKVLEKLKADNEFKAKQVTIEEFKKIHEEKHQHD
jgi:trigger factor